MHKVKGYTALPALCQYKMDAGNREQEFVDQQGRQPSLQFTKESRSKS